MANGTNEWATGCLLGLDEVIDYFCVVFGCHGEMVYCFGGYAAVFAQ